MIIYKLTWVSTDFIDIRFIDSSNTEMFTSENENYQEVKKVVVEWGLTDFYNHDDELYEPDGVYIDIDNEYLIKDVYWGAVIKLTRRFHRSQTIEDILSN